MPDLRDVPQGTRLRLPCGCVASPSTRPQADPDVVHLTVEGESGCGLHAGRPTIAVHGRTQVVVLGSVDDET